MVPCKGTEPGSTPGRVSNLGKGSEKGKMDESRARRFKAFLAEILRDDYDLKDVAEVTSYYEDSYDIGYCETCSYIVHEIHVTYSTFDGEEKTHVISGSMSELLS